MNYREIWISHVEVLKMWCSEIHNYQKREHLNIGVQKGHAASRKLDWARTVTTTTGRALNIRRVAARYVTSRLCQIRGPSPRYLARSLHYTDVFALEQSFFFSIKRVSFSTVTVHAVFGTQRPMLHPCRFIFSVFHCDIIEYMQAMVIELCILCLISLA